MSEPGFFDTLEAQLGAGFEQTVRRRRTRRRVAQRLGAATVAVLAVLGIGAFVLNDQPAAAGVRVEERGGLVYVRLTDVEYRADVIEDAARDAGIDVSVEAVPTGPSLVGRFVAYQQAGNDTGELRKLDPDGPAFAGFSLPAGYSGTLVLHVGRPGRDDEPYAIFPNALAAGEPLACSGVIGRSASDAQDILRARAVDVRWAVQTNVGSRPVSDPMDVADGLQVRRAVSIAPGIVSILLSDATTSLPSTDLTANAIC